MKILNSTTYWVKIYISGSLETIENECRKECFESGWCVTVDKTKFIYTGGEEFGAVIGIIQYPRFMKKHEDIYERSLKLAKRLLKVTYQQKVLIMRELETNLIMVK